MNEYSQHSIDRIVAEHITDVLDAELVFRNPVKITPDSVSLELHDPRNRTHVLEEMICSPFFSREWETVRDDKNVQGIVRELAVGQFPLEVRYFAAGCLLIMRTDDAVEITQELLQRNPINTDLIDNAEMPDLSYMIENYYHLR